VTSLFELLLGLSDYLGYYSLLLELYKESPEFSEFYIKLKKYVMRTILLMCK